MASLSTDTTKRLMTSLTSAAAGNEVATALNSLTQGSYVLAGAIIATNVSTTIDFGSLLVGDLVVRVAVAAATTLFYTVVTAGTLPAAAVVGSLYIVLRPTTSNTVSALTF